MAEKIDMTEEELLRRDSWKHHGAAAAAYESVAKYLYDESGRLFAHGRDEYAKTYRNLAQHFSDWGRESRREQHKFADHIDKEI